MRALVVLAALAYLLAPAISTGGVCYYRVPEDLLTPFAANLFDSVLVSSSIVHDDTTSAEGGWSPAYWARFCSAMVDSGAGGWSGSAINLLNYFGKGDRDPAPDRVYFDNGPRTGLAMWGYDRTDFCADCDCDPTNGTSGDCAPGTEDCIAAPWWCGSTCNPLYTKEVSFWGAGTATGFKAYVNKYQGTRFSPEAVAQLQMLNHELTHHIHENAVLYTYPQTWDDLGFLTSWSVNYTEFWAPLGELIGPNRSTQADGGEARAFYDSLVNDRYGFEQIYSLRRVYWNWMMSNFAGGDFGDVPPDYSDDLAKAVYDQYVVRATGDTLSNQFWDGLGRALIQNPVYGDLFPGETGDEKVQSFIHVFGMARIAVDASYRDLPLGWPDPDTKGPLSFGFYADDRGAKRADVIPPRVTLGETREATVDVSTWTDPVDGTRRSSDYILPFASDYVLIHADSAYFATRDPATLEITVSNTLDVNRSLAAVVGYVTFDTEDSLVYNYSVEDAFVGSVHDVDMYGDFTANLTVPSFGGQNQTVAVVITSVPNTYNIPNTLSNSSGGLYSSSYGMRWQLTGRLDQTRVSGEVSGTWTADASPYLVTGVVTVPEGSALFIEPGTEVLFDGNDYLESYGTIEAKGVRFASNRIGKRFEALYVSGAADFDSCTVEDAQYGIAVWEATAPVRIENSSFHNCPSALYMSGNRTMDVVFDSNTVEVPALYDATAVRLAAGSRGVTVIDNTITPAYGGQHPYRGIHIMNCVGADADTHAVIEGNLIDGFDFGICVERLAPRIRGNIGRNCETGIFIRRKDAQVEVTGNSFDGCLLTGLFAEVDSLYAAKNSFRGCGLYGIDLADGDCLLRRNDCDSSLVPLYIDSDHPNLNLGRLGDRGGNGLVPATSRGASITVGANCAVDTLLACGNYITCAICGPPPPAPPVLCGDLDSWTSAASTVVNLCLPLCRPPEPSEASAAELGTPVPARPWFAPNPTRAGGVLTFSSSKRGRAVVDVVDVTGRLVRHWDETVEEGTTGLVWNGLSSHGTKVSRGVYFFRVVTPDERTTVKVVVR